MLAISKQKIFAAWLCFVPVLQFLFILRINTDDCLYFPRNDKESIESETALTEIRFVYSVKNERRHYYRHRNDHLLYQGILPM